MLKAPLNPNQPLLWRIGMKCGQDYFGSDSAFTFHSLRIGSVLTRLGFIFCFDRTSVWWKSSCLDFILMVI